jgi:hypothetical protein
MSTIFFHFTCVIPLGATHDSNQTIETNVHMLSHTSKKIINKISKTTIPYRYFKTMTKAIKYKCKKIKKQEDDRCLWKKTILMGEKCQPMEFPGAIFYDDKGNRLNEPPRSKHIVL